MKPWMIYGANGYSGKLIAREAVRRGYEPILAGRSAAAVSRLAAELDLPHRVFQAVDTSEAREHLADLSLILNCAGPFTETAPSLVDASIEAACHYMDLTGELDVYAYCHKRHEAARRRGVVLCPGVAFDVVPTEAIAAKLKEALPDANSLVLGLDSDRTLSPGSAITLLKGIGDPNLTVYMRREAAHLVKANRPLIRRFAFASGQSAKPAMSVTWADLNAAFYSTQIPNITVFIAANLSNRVTFALAHHLRFLYRNQSVQNMMRRVIKRFVKGPSREVRESGSTQLFGIVTNADGEERRLDLTVAQGYKFTYLAALAIVEHSLAQEADGGYYTPSMLVGAELTTELEGSSGFTMQRQ